VRSVRRNPRHRHLASYRLSVEFRQRWASYLGLILLVALVGGVSMASFAAARETQSAFPAFLRSTNPSNINIDNGPYDPKLLHKVEALPGVTSEQSYVALNLSPVKANGTPDYSNPVGNVEPVGILDKLYIDQDKITITSGRMLNPRKPDEVVVSEFAAKVTGVRLGERLREGIFDNSQLDQDGEPSSPADHRLTLTVVGIGVFNDEVVQDDVDRIPRMLLSPALTDPLKSCCVSYAWTGIQLRSGAAGVQAFLHQYQSHFPPETLAYYHVTSVIEQQAEQSVKPESLALGVFGLIAGIAVLLIAAQAIARQVRLSSTDREILRSLGADPTDTVLDGLAGVSIAAVVGAILAAGVAVALSPLSPFGPVRKVDTVHGLNLDWTVLGMGTALLLLALLALAFVFSWRDAPHVVARRRQRQPERSSAVVAAAASAGFPATATTGIRFALETGRGRSAVPVRSSILGTLLAMVVVVAALTFGDSLNTFISHPALYGWNWNYIFESDAGYGGMPPSATDKVLSHDHAVTAWTGGHYAYLTLNGMSVPVLGEQPGGKVQPSILSGHDLEAPGQVVLGTETLQQLHKHVGDTVIVDTNGVPHKVTVVGTATMPTVGVGHGLHLSMGIGALLDTNLIPAPNLDIQAQGSGPNVYFVRTRPGRSQREVVHTLTADGNAISNDAGAPGSVQLSSVQHPAQIVNYRSMGATPALLAGALALGAVSALGLTLGASVRRRRHDLALLKTLGFTRWQLGSAVAWQASVSVGIGTVIGVPLGIALGRALWVLFAEELYAVPHPTVSVPSIALVVVAALLLANLVAAVPGWRAARTSTALVLRSE
jgi:FtsX-like permease family/MacB-like periplasmic core domain